MNSERDDFYSSISGFYDLLFPEDAEQIAFLKSFCGPADSSGSLLDIGCATGTVLQALEGSFNTLYGIDLDPGLLEQAVRKIFSADKRKQREEKFFLLKGNMLNIDTLFADQRFSYISCLGNTLPHLEGMKEISQLLGSVYKRLEDGGKFIFQVINYERVILQQIRSLPTIQNGCVSFERNYSPIKANGHVDFSTVLTISSEELQTAHNRELVNSVELFPVTEGELTPALSEAGFKKITYYGNFAATPYSRTSFLLIGVCEK